MLPFLISLALFAADPSTPPPADWVVFPDAAAPVAPAPVPAPGAAVQLPAGTQYVFTSTRDCYPLACPAGCVTVVKKTGPRDITGIFAGGTGAEEDRTVAGPFVWVVKPTRPGAVTLQLIPYGFKADDEVRRVRLDSMPGKPIIDPVKPVPPVDPDVLPAGKKLLLKIVDDSRVWPAARADMLADLDLRAQVKTLTGADLEIVQPESKAAADMGLMPFVVKAGGIPAMILVDADGANIGAVRLAAKLPDTKPAFLAAIAKLYGK